LSTRQSAFCRKGDVIVQVGTDKRLVRLINVIHDATVVNTGRKDRRKGPNTNKPYIVFWYNKFTKDVDRTDKYLSYYSVQKKTVKWLNVYARLNTLQCIFVYETLNTNKKVCIKTSCMREQCPE
jgi:hypothetical protein